MDTLTATASVAEEVPPLVIHQVVGPWRDPWSVAAFAETTPVFGLVVAPRIERDYDTGQWRFRNAWVVLHTFSGRRALTCPRASLGHVREAAELLGETGIDWARTELDVDDAMREAVHSVARQVWDAARDGRPVLMEETSWRQMPPRWLVEAVEGNGHLIEAYVIQDYAGAEKVAVEIGADLNRHEPEGNRDVTICRLPEPEWELRCARRGCPAVLVDEEFGFPQRDSDRRTLLDCAEAGDWRQLDPRRWLCHVCNPLFRATHD